MLEQIRVIDLSDGGALLCGQILADLGADVIQVEPPGGAGARRLGPFAGGVADPECSLFWWAYARGKRGIVIDFDSEACRESSSATSAARRSTSAEGASRAGSGDTAAKRATAKLAATERRTATGQTIRGFMGVPFGFSDPR